MKLAGHVKGVVLQLNQFHQLAVGRSSAENQPQFLESLPIGVVEFVTMAVPLVDQERAVEVCRFASNGQLPQ